MNTGYTITEERERERYRKIQKNVISVIKCFYISKCLYFLSLGYMNGEIQGSCSDLKKTKKTNNILLNLSIFIHYIAILGCKITTL